MFCPACGTRARDDQRFCASCGTALETDVTRLAGDVVTRVADRPASASRRTPSDGVTSSSGGGGGRFPAGHLLGARYRIVRRLGRGGMGEVYLADDLTLGQAVALKFLPESIEHDPRQLAQLQNEVRLARQVAHPNVCRVYDIGEADGVHFLSMEYIDGEDLASLLRRIGRLPEERANDLARQLAFGVAAAHARGMLHRDLKPSNVMIDGEGRLHITDFGLAVPGQAASAALAGTPAYMAPEQLAGQPASAASDLFAVGLVLYEIYTGKRVFTARTVEDLKDQHAGSTIVAPSAVVPGLHPDVDRVVLQCLDRDVEHRPVSALAIATALPGGDPLAAALAAGQTPSPELVAASGGSAATVRPGIAALAVAAVVAALLVSAWLADRFGLHADAPLTVAWAALDDRARSFESAIGAGAGAVDRATGMITSYDAIRWLQSDPPGVDPPAALASGRLPTTVFWYRSSGRPLVPMNLTRARPSPNDPPLNDTGMTAVVLDTRGRLLEYSAVPVQVDRAGTSATPSPWARFFEAAGLDPSRFTPAAPEWTPRVFADERVAWTGTVEDLPGVTLRVEAASYRGTPVNFQIAGPWTRPARMTPPPTTRATEIVAVVASAVVIPACLVGGLWLARGNLRRGRGDRRGALRLSLVVFGLEMAAWIVGARHFASIDGEQARFGAALASGLLAAAVYGLLYLAIEPEVRRMRPAMLITWSRLVAGRFRDPMVGRDLLFGAVAGLALTFVTWAHYLLPGWFGWRPFLPAAMTTSALEGTGGLLASALSLFSDALSNAIIGGVGIALLGRVVGDIRVVFVIATLAFSFLAARGQIETGHLWLDLLVGVLLVVPVLGVIVRYGFVAGVVGFFVHFVTLNVPASFDATQVSFTPGLVMAVVSAGLAAAGASLAMRSSGPTQRRLPQ